VSSRLLVPPRRDQFVDQRRRPRRAAIALAIRVGGGLATVLVSYVARSGDARWASPPPA